jgi:hypothetical protein
MIVSPPIVIIFMGSYYARSMTHAIYIWVLMIMSTDVFIEYGYGSEMGMDASTLILRTIEMNLIHVTITIGCFSFF